MRWHIAIVVVVLAVFAATLVFFSRSLFEPTYKARSLSEWLIDFDSFSGEQRAEANEAVRQMGGRAVPFLVDRLSQRTPQWKIKLRQLLSNQSIIHFRFPPNESAIDATRRRARVFAACDALGAEAGNAVPALEEALSKFRDFDAAYVMARVGQAAVPALTRASTSKDYFVRASAGYFLHVLRDQPQMLVVPTTNLDFFRRAGAAEKTMLAIWLPKAALYVPQPGAGVMAKGSATTNK